MDAMDAIIFGTNFYSWLLPLLNFQEMMSTKGQQTFSVPDSEWLGGAKRQNWRYLTQQGRKSLLLPASWAWNGWSWSEGKLRHSLPGEPRSGGVGPAVGDSWTQMPTLDANSEAHSIQVAMCAGPGRCRGSAAAGEAGAGAETWDTGWMPAA